METMERKKPRTRRLFTPEFKAEIVERYKHGVRVVEGLQRFVARGNPVIMTGPLRRPLEFADVQVIPYLHGHVIPYP